MCRSGFILLNGSLRSWFITVNVWIIQNDKPSFLFYWALWNSTFIYLHIYIILTHKKKIKKFSLCSCGNLYSVDNYYSLSLLSTHVHANVLTVWSSQFTECKCVISFWVWRTRRSRWKTRDVSPLISSLYCLRYWPRYRAEDITLFNPV